jgi:hypothetical protein
MVDPDGDALPACPIDEIGRIFDRLGTIVLRAPFARGAASDVYCGPGRAEFDRYPAPGPARPPATRATLPSNGGVIRTSFRSPQKPRKYNYSG